MERSTYPRFQGMRGLKATSQLLTTKTSPFLRLPAEIRTQIYGYLLLTRYTKYYPVAEDANWEYKHIQPHSPKYTRRSRPAPAYHYHVGILRANRMIYVEASKVLYDQNMFVEFKSDLTSADIDFKWLGVPVVAQNATAARFVYCALQIRVKPKRVSRYKKGTPLHLIFAGADMPIFCTALLLGGRSQIQIFKSSLSINLSCSTAAEEDKARTSFSIPLQKSLLEPLRSLHSFQTVSITGPLDEQYKTELCLSICKNPPSFQKRLSDVLDRVREGDEAFNTARTTAHYHRAITVYNTAMIELKDGCSRLYRSGGLGMGLVPTLHADEINLKVTYSDLVCKLQISLAAAHFELGHYAQSRKWGYDAFETLGEDHTAFSPDPRCGKAYLLLARSNNKLGRWEEAVEWMEEAVRIVPHLQLELECFKEDKKIQQEVQFETVRRVLAESRNSENKPVVVKYPSDFDRVKKRLSSQRPSS